MRIAILSDIHGNRTAFEAVLADLRETAPDVVLHGGDLADSGSGPVEVVDRIRDLGWTGVMGNTDEMLFAPEVFAEFATKAPQFGDMFAALGEMAAATRGALGDERISWLRGLPRLQTVGSVALVHGRPETAWRAPMPEAADSELQDVYRSLGATVVVYGHIHRPFFRSVAGMTVVNCGSVGLSQDGDARASYLLLDELIPTIRRVEYDLELELERLREARLPYAEWVARMLRAAAFVGI